MFDKKRCIANIYQLAKEQGIKIGDLEKKAGTSAGYLSRINKDDNNSSPSIDFIAAVAMVLGVTVDALIKNDYTTPTATEKYLLDFIDTLLSRTNADELDWKKHKLESRLPGEISVTSDMQMTPPLWQKRKRSSKAS